MIDHGRVTRPRVEYQVECWVQYSQILSRILADSLSINVEFLVVYMGQSRIVIWLFDYDP